MDNKIDLKKQIIALVVSLLTSLIISFIPDWTKVSFTTADQVLLATGLFIAFLLLDVLWIIGQYADKVIKNNNEWKVENSCDIELTNIRNYFHQLTQDSYGPRDLFVGHYLKEIRKISNSIREAAEKKEVLVQADHLLSVDNVLDAFQGDDDRIWRYTWPFSDDSVLFSEVPWKRYFEVTATMLQKKKIKGIRALFIIKDHSLLVGARFCKILDYMSCTPGMDCRIILKDVFQVIAKDNGISPEYPDFGIYGKKLLFITSQYEPVTMGVFIKEEKQIDKYIRLFDTIWDSQSITKKNPSQNRKCITLQELFEFDDQQDSKEMGAL
jgi:hypothetical protein